MLLTDRTDYPRAYGFDRFCSYIIPYEGAHPVWVHGDLARDTLLSIYRLSTQYQQEEELLLQPTRAGKFYQRCNLSLTMLEQFTNWYRLHGYVGL